MNKTAIKNFAIWARVNLIEAVKQRAYEYEVTKDGANNKSLEAVGGRILTTAERDQRRALIDEISKKGFEQVMEEAAYTWFNRFIALRFMEVNGYLPARVRVFTNEEGEFKPEIMKEAMTVEIDGLKRDIVLDLIDKQNNEELYKYLLITQCNALGVGLPKMFERIEHWTELLFPANLLRADGVIGRMVTDIPEEDWKDAVQIIGWLYQFYNTEPKAAVFAKNGKVSKEEIPAATQLFTPDWIVRYMVENSLGRLWLEGHPNDEMKAEWKYYLDEAKQDDAVEAQIAKIREEAKSLRPQDIKVIDPCMGSGHILVYAFDVLMQIYTSAGWSERDAAKSIVENNLYGLDIDDRAGQLAYFAVMMKARQYNRRALAGGVAGVLPNVYSIQESNNISRFAVEDFCNGDAKALEEMDKLIKLMRDAKEYGSILNIKDVDFELLFDLCDASVDKISLHNKEINEDIIPLVRIAYLLSQKYHIAITNPPYMTVSGMPSKVIDYIKKNYSDSKADLFSVFIEKCLSLVVNSGYQAMITMHSWMYLSSYEKLRDKLLPFNLINMLHLGARAFEEISGEVVQTTSFVIRKNASVKFNSLYFRLVDANTQDGKEQKFLLKNGSFVVSSENFSKIPGSPFAYNSSEAIFDAFKKGLPLDSVVSSRQGLACGDVNKYRRNWFEVNIGDIGFNCSSIQDFHGSGKKYVPINDGGEYRKWYGNNDPILRFDKPTYDVLLTIGNHLPSREKYFNRGITWTAISSNLSLRYFEEGFLFSNAGMAIFGEESILKSLCALLNSTIVKRILSTLNESINFNKGDIARLPIINSLMGNEDIAYLSGQCIEFSKTDWDSFETSWDFKVHPFVKHANSLWDATAVGATMSKYYGRELPKHNSPLELCYLLWQGECNERFNNLKANEEELNRIFIDIYGLQDELTPDVADKDVTVRKADLGRDIRSFISYAVGCIFGRYSLNAEGICYAGGAWDETKYQTIIPDRDNILPICDDEYFEDDILGKFINFVKVVYGADTLEENLKFIASALGGKGTAREVIRSYFLNDFYADHLKIYQKRPIYWMFDSGKKNGFKALVYIHRYQPDLLARMRTDYVHEQQERYRTQIEAVEDAKKGAPKSEEIKLDKKLASLRAQSLEIAAFEEKIHHLADMMISIDLDDGVKVNYAKFEEVLAKIK